MSGIETDEWIGVEQVAAELKLTNREAWELVRRIGVPLLEAGRGRIDRARFRRSDWNSRRDASTKPPEPRRPQSISAPVRPTKSEPAIRVNKLRAAMRKG